MKITELKKKALETCEGNWGILVWATLLFSLISVAMVSSGTIGGVVTMTAIFPLIYFIYVKCLMLKRNNKNGVKLRETNITLRMAWNYIKYNLWLLLLFLPGLLLILIGTWATIIRPLRNKLYIGSALSNLSRTSIIIFLLCIIIASIYCMCVKIVYALTIFMIAENNECDSTLKIMKEARLLIKGNMIKYVLLRLSFIGWGILANISGIGYLWLLPYMELTKIEFYYSLKENKDIKENKEVQEVQEIKENNM